MLVLAVIAVAGFLWLRERGLTAPVAGQQRCVAKADGRSVSLDLDQAHYASIIAGISVRRKLPSRAASIALAVVYQETGIRNLDYGDRDSVGLFQQRPSQGWGTEKQLMDPYYATGKFYDALVKVADWETDRIADVAQKVQRSGYPTAYRDHEQDARVLASVFTGHSPGGLSCLDRSKSDGDSDGLVTAMRKTFGRLDVDANDRRVRLTTASDTRAWAYAHFAVANGKYHGVSAVQARGREWRNQTNKLASWTGTESGGADPVQISLR